MPAPKVANFTASDLGTNGSVPVDFAQKGAASGLVEFGCSHVRSEEAGHMFPFVVGCWIILLMHRAKGVRP